MTLSMISQQTRPELHSAVQRQIAPSAVANTYVMPHARGTTWALSLQTPPGTAGALQSTLDPLELTWRCRLSPWELMSDCNRIRANVSSARESGGRVRRAPFWG